MELPKTRISLIFIAKRFENVKKINARTPKASKMKDKKPSEPNRNWTGDRTPSIQDDLDYKLTNSRRNDMNRTPIEDKSFPYKKCKNTHRIGRYPEIEYSPTTKWDT